ncbi:MAG: hypothetical protein JXA73_24075 [Acidobacteria bacterium]|nr:hypothetical protein [Acidobacteriota bacterium]
MIKAQDETLADIKYQEDYDRIQTIIKTSNVIKRAEKMVNFYGERRDIDSKLRNYADNLFARDLEALTKQSNYIAVRGLCEQALKIRPKFGEVYFFYGVALKNSKKIDEAMDAFAKGASIPNPLSTKSKQQLDLAYRAVHGGSLVGQDKLIKNAMKDLK